jgi:nucleotide-binding universal stress UspA family protein
MYKHILIATDGSDLSKVAIQSGVALAKALDARVTAMTVTMPFHIYAIDPSMITDTLEQYTKRMVVLAEKYLDVAKNTATASGVMYGLVHVEHEQPYQAIIDTAQKRGCDLIVMASHGRSGIAAVLLGSVTSKVLTHTNIPVLVCHC